MDSGGGLSKLSIHQADAVAVHVHQWRPIVVMHPGVTRARLTVALLLAEHAGTSMSDDYAGRLRPVWPARSRIAAQSGLSTKTVGDSLESLRALGLLREVDRTEYVRAVPEMARADPRVRAFVLTHPRVLGAISI